MFWIGMLKRQFPTGIATVPCLLCCLVYTSFTLFATWMGFSFWFTLLLQPLVFFFAFFNVRGYRGSPATLRGIKTSESSDKNNKSSNDAKKKPFTRFQLVAMPINHYGEKLRWSLDLIGAPYQEETVGGLISAFFRGRSVPWLVDKTSCSILGNSDEAMLYLNAVYVPLIEDSSQRLAAEKFLMRTPETMKWEQRLANLGHCVQGWAYSYLLAEDAPSWPSKLAWGAFEPHVPAMDRFIISKLHSYLKKGMRQSFKLSDNKYRDERFKQIQSMMTDVDEALKNNKFICGDHLTYVDIGFASLIAPTFSQGLDEDTMYSNRRFSSFRGAIKKHGGWWPPALKEFEADSMTRASGKHVMRLYKELRSKKIWEL